MEKNLESSKQSILSLAVYVTTAAIGLYLVATFLLGPIDANAYLRLALVALVIALLTFALWSILKTKYKNVAFVAFFALYFTWYLGSISSWLPTQSILLDVAATFVVGLISTFGMYHFFNSFSPSRSYVWIKAIIALLILILLPFVLLYLARIF